MATQPLSPQRVASDAYMLLLKRNEPELTHEQRALARESFNEGWQQCELAQPK